MKTVIMAGGRGTRIAELFPDIPKPLIPFTIKKTDPVTGKEHIIEKPVLQWEIESLRNQGFADIILTVSYMADKIKDYFGDGSSFGVNISYFVEETPLGNAGALFKLKDVLDEPFLLLNADAIFDVDFNRMIAFHRSKNALVTLFTHPNSHPYDSGLILTGSDGSVENWLTKEETRPLYYKNRVNAGLHIIDPTILDMASKDIDADQIGRTDEVNRKVIKVDLDRQILKPLCGKHIMYAYDSPEYVKDMGTPERFHAVSRDFINGIVAAKNLSKPQKAVFLDRDGTINKYVGFLTDIDQFELVEGAAEAIRLINESGYLAIVVSNQPVIARGEVTTDELSLIHDKMETLLGAEGAYIDGLYYCPHHPDSGFYGEVKELKIICSCRKPKPGMILEAAKRFNIDLTTSWMIGDSENDIRCGKASGCYTALIQDEEKSDFDEKVRNYGQDMTDKSLLEIVKQIFKMKANP